MSDRFHVKSNTAVRRLRRFAATGAVVLACAACAGGADSLYARIRAFFHYSRVTTTAPLYGALGNPGQFCKITFGGGRYNFTDNDGRSYACVPTALDQRWPPEAVAGFLVGTPAIPDLNGNFYNVAYDLVCPNCYLESIDRALDFVRSSRTAVACGRCRRVYNLDNGGVVAEGGEGRPLYRYRMNYQAAQGVLIIQN